ncbi:MAG: DUF721 domain-containing protein [Akkermansiaceae bacterium]
MESNPQSDSPEPSIPDGSVGGASRIKRRSKRQRRDSKSRLKARNQILSEWRGGIDPPSSQRNIHQADEYLADLLKLVGLSDGIDEQRLKEGWSRVAGDFVSKHTVPDSIREGVLVLRVVNPMMKFHLQQMSAQLLRNLGNELGQGVVKQIVFKVG